MPRDFEPIRRFLVALPLVSLAFLTTTAGATMPPKLTVIGDSVADRMERNAGALTSLRDGFRLNLQTRGCRRLVTVGCTIDDNRGPPPSVLDVVHRFGPWLGRAVVIESGYNDPPTHYGHDLDTVMGALRDARIKTVVWLTVRDAQHALYLENSALRAATRRWPQLVIADWDAYSANHPDWFDADGIHPTPLGAASLGQFIHDAVASALGPQHMIRERVHISCEFQHDEFSTHAMHRKTPRSGMTHVDANTL
jgi:hypothetical protein